MIYSGLLWTSLNLFYPVSATAQAPALAASGAAALRKAAHPLAALIGITALSGELSNVMLGELLFFRGTANLHNSTVQKVLSWQMWPELPAVKNKIRKQSSEFSRNTLVKNASLNRLCFDTMCK